MEITDLKVPAGPIVSAKILTFSHSRPTLSDRYAKRDDTGPD